MARQPNEDGYRASAVDNFIDRLEVSYAEIIDENQRLKMAGAGGDPALHQHLQMLTRERDELKARLAAGQGGDPGQMAAMQAHIEEITRANQELQARLAAAASGAGGVGQEEMMQALQRAQAAEAAQATALQELTQLRSQASGGPESQARLAQVNEENTLLRSRAASLEAQISDLQAQAAAQATGALDDQREIVVSTSAEAAPAVVLMVDQTLKQVQTLMDNAKLEIDQHRAEAETEARRLIESATQQADELTRRAQNDADSVHSEAALAADRLITDAKSRTIDIDSEASERRSQLFGQLEREREGLSERIGQLRDFESQYRQSMSSHLQRQIDSLRDTEFAPSQRPELLDASANPRLSALSSR